MFTWQGVPPRYQGSRPRQKGYVMYQVNVDNGESKRRSCRQGEKKVEESYHGGEERRNNKEAEQKL